MSPFFLFAVIILAVVAMVIAISKFNVHPFIVLVVVAVAVGLVCGLDTVTVVNTVKTGFGDILASIGIVILCGTIIGTILEKTGAALTSDNPDSNTQSIAEGTKVRPGTVITVNFVELDQVL